MAPVSSPGWPVPRSRSAGDDEMERGLKAGSGPTTIVYAKRGGAARRQSGRGGGGEKKLANAVDKPVTIA